MLKAISPLMNCSGANYQRLGTALPINRPQLCPLRIPKKECVSCLRRELESAGSAVGRKGYVVVQGIEG